MRGRRLLRAFNHHLRFTWMSTPILHPRQDVFQVVVTSFVPQALVPDYLP